MEKRNLLTVDEMMEEIEGKNLSREALLKQIRSLAEDGTRLCKENIKLKVEIIEMKRDFIEIFGSLLGFEIPED